MFGNTQKQAFYVPDATGYENADPPQHTFVPMVQTKMAAVTRKEIGGHLLPRISFFNIEVLNSLFFLEFDAIQFLLQDFVLMILRLCNLHLNLLELLKMFLHDPLRPSL